MKIAVTFRDSDYTEQDYEELVAGDTKFVTVRINVTNVGEVTNCIKLNVLHNNPGVTLNNVTSVVPPDGNLTQVCVWHACHT